MSSAEAQRRAIFAPSAGKYKYNDKIPFCFTTYVLKLLCQSLCLAKTCWHFEKKKYLLLSKYNKNAITKQIY